MGLREGGHRVYQYWLYPSMTTKKTTITEPEIDRLKSVQMEGFTQSLPLLHFGSHLQIHDKDEALCMPKANVLQKRIDDAIATLRAMGVPVRLLVTKIRQSGGTTFCLHAG